LAQTLDFTGFSANVDNVDKYPEKNESPVKSAKKYPHRIFPDFPKKHVDIVDN